MSSGMPAFPVGPFTVRMGLTDSLYSSLHPLVAYAIPSTLCGSMPLLECIHSSHCVRFTRQHSKGGVSSTVLCTCRSPRRLGQLNPSALQRRRHFIRQRTCGRTVAAQVQQDDRDVLPSEQRPPGPAPALPTLMDGVTWWAEVHRVSQS